MFDSQQNLATAAQTATYYEHLWSTLGTKLDYTEINRVRFVVDSIREFVGCTGLKILDFGCGRGWMTRFLSPLGSVTGVDFSPAGIQFARENYGEHASFLLADSQSPRLGLRDDCQFDVVVCSEVIEHVPVHSALLFQVAGFLRPGGWCMLTTPNGNVWPQFSRHPGYSTQLQPVENWLTTRQLAALFRQAGFRIARHEGRPVYEFRIGLAGWLQQRRVEALFRKLGLYHLWGRLILPTALYQVVAAQKTP
jgi:2-polyprenyl-3-methyl-5-hydroxy-6-metoxy-1,4-benzoquinol methylase